MTQEELINRVEVWLNLADLQKREPLNRQELNTLYQAITGTRADCSDCVNWLLKMAAKLREYAANPDSFTIKPTQTEIMESTSKKYRRSAAAIANDATQIVLNHGDGNSELIDLDHMTDAQAERLLASEQYKHNVEVISAADSSSDEDEGDKAPKLTEKQQLQARYKELTNEEATPQTTVAELKAKITELEANGSANSNG